MYLKREEIIGKNGIKGISVFQGTLYHANHPQCSYDQYSRE